MSTVPSKVVCVGIGMESCKYQHAILGFNGFLVVSKHKRRHYQSLRNHQKLTSTGLRYRNMVVCSSVGSGPPMIPSDPNPGSWKLWLLGVLMSVIIPFWRGKWGPLLKLKEEVETVIDTAEAVTDVVEKVAEQVEKVADEIGNKLPAGKLKDAFEYVDDIAEETADKAHLAGEFIDKVEDVVDEVEKQVESVVEPVGATEKAKEKTEEAKGVHA